MTTSLVDAESILAIDIGSIHTRALLFDVVDGQYRFVGASRSASTYGAPFFDISEGIYQAAKKIEEITGRTLLIESRLMIPSRTDGVGVDQLVMTYSAGQAIKVVTLGLLEDVSLESANRLASTVNAFLAEKIGMNDRRKAEVQLDAILKSQPELLILAGGTDDGATRSIAKLVDLVALALQVTARDRRPEILYSGNQAISKNIQDSLSKLTNIHVAPNVRPTIDQENIGPAQDQLMHVLHQIRSRQIGGMQSYSSICASTPMPTPMAFGRMVRFLSGINNPKKSVLGIDVGANAFTLAAAREGNLDLQVLPYGIGGGLSKTLEQTRLEEITRWLPMVLPDDFVRDYLFQKTLLPNNVPITQDSLAIEQAVARQIIQLAIKNSTLASIKNNNSYEPILASGLVLTQNTTPAQSLLMLLDSIQPAGITTFVLDPYGLTPSLGAIAATNPILTVQIMESNAFTNLGTVISPISSARYGTPILKVRVEYESGQEIALEVQQGMITPLPIQPGQVARVHLQPLRPVQIDPSNRSQVRSFKITGGACGAIIDARGRPLNLPPDAARRRDMLKKWTLALGV